MSDIKYGLQVLQNNIQNAPETFGVYRMLGENDKVLYVGKAKNIKKRIKAYSQLEKLPLRLQKMVSEIKRMEFIITENEAKALLLENELIKKLEPHYNILLKDDKTFPHLMIDMYEEYPALRKHRGKRNDKNKYFGPFASVASVNNVLDILQKAFLLRNCNNTFFRNRSRPCLQYQIKRCAAPCVGRISKEDYAKLVKQAVDFLEGKNARIQEELAQKMNEASEALDYEVAAVFRDRIRALTNIQQGNNVEYGEIKSADVVVIYSAHDRVSIQVFFIRQYQNCGNVPYFPTKTEGVSENEILEAFLSSFYSNHVPPREIIVNLELENAEFLSSAIGAKITTYVKGNKAKLIKNVYENAKGSLERKVALENSYEKNLKEFQEVFGLGHMPKRIEIYDNSHIQGAYAIGAMVVATPEGFDKKQYRKFNIKNQDITNDDFAMMKEVMQRRFARLSEENRPDVVLIDGGLGQLSAVMEALKDVDLTGINIVAISKGVDRNAGKEFYHMPGRESFSLPYRSSIAFYLQNLRDEAHRFAIGTHRIRRAKSIYKSSLDEIEGIGAKRKKDLLNYFGSVEQIKEASLKDIGKVVGINKKTAEKIYNYFHS